MGEMDEAHELQEHAEHGAGDPKMAPVSFTMAVLAVVLATVTLLGHRAHTHQVLLQTKVNDQWGFFQGNAIRRSNNEVAARLMGALDFKDKEKADKTREFFASEGERYREKQKDIEAEARKLEDETNHESRLANRYDLAEVFLEIALVVTSITLLTRRRAYWGLGGLMAVTGVAIAISAIFVG